MKRRRHRARVYAGSALLAASGLGATLAYVAADSPSAAEAASEAPAPASTAKVTKRDLVDRSSVSGTLGYGETSEVRSHRPGTLTTTSDPGTVLERGQVAYTVDGRPVPLLYGDLPSWRRLAAGDSGADVALLEQNLVALGYASEEELKGDSKYDSRTAAAVKRWQKDLGVEQTGTIELGDVEYVPGPVRVAALKADVGSSVGPGAPVLEVTGTERVVAVRLEASKQSLAKEGDAVQVVLPNGSSVNGHIKNVGRVATADDNNGTPKITVLITLDDPKVAGSLDQAPVSVKLTKSTATGVLAVPVRALLALAEGGYAVELQRDTGRELVAVELGAFADGWVEVTGSVREGDTVVTAS